MLLIETLIRDFVTPVYSKNQRDVNYSIYFFLQFAVAEILLPKLISKTLALRIIQIGRKWTESFANGLF